MTNSFEITYLTNDQIDRALWDRCIDRSINGMEYAKSWYLDLVADDWDALVEKDYVSVFPLVFRKKWNIRYIYQPYFTQQLGLFSSQLLNASRLEAFFRAIPHQFKFIEMNLNTLNKADLPGAEVSHWLNHELDLIHPYEQLRAHYSANHIRNLKKAEEAGLTLQHNIKPEEVINMFRENRGKNLSKITDDDYKLLSRLIHTAIYKGLAEVYGVYSRTNNLCAGAVFLTSGKKKIFLFSGLNDEGRKNRAMVWLIDRFIEKYQRQHLTLDFEGSNDPGLARFYKGFGSTPVTYPHVVINRLPAVIRALAPLYRRLK
ncbi:MAG: hypothetical protein Kow00127_20500 [Bacteroidales bacterium]